MVDVTVTSIPTAAGVAAVSWLMARGAAHATARALPPHRVPLLAAAGLTLSKPITASTPLPPFDTAAMDGYAVAGPARGSSPGKSSRRASRKTPL